MKLAILMQCHKAPEQINIFLNIMKNKNITFFIHVDKKSDIDKDILKREDVVMLPKNLRVDVQWAAFSQVEATLNLLKYANSYDKYDFFMLVSGQDFPIKSSEKIVEFLSNKSNYNFVNFFSSHNNGLNNGSNYDKRNEIVYTKWLFKRDIVTRVIRRSYVFLTGGYTHTFKIFKRKVPYNIKFYFGSSWWCLNKKTIDWILDYLNSHDAYISFFEKSICADESFFQTLVMKSPFSNESEDYLHYIDWSQGGSSPKNLTVVDYERITRSGKLLARKIDGDKALIDRLIAQLNM